MKKIFYFLAVLSMMATACKDDKETVTDPVNYEPKEKVIEISTSFGKMYMWLYKQTPLHRENFLKLADSAFFNGTTFHRIVPDFVIQGGDPNSKDTDPTNDGKGGPGYTIPAEIKDSLKHVRGAVGAARLPDSMNPERASSGSQFYIVMPQNGTTNLNGAYTVFGYIMKGMDVAESIVSQSRDGNNRPIQDIQMQVRVIQKSLSEIKAEYNYIPPK